MKKLFIFVVFASFLISCSSTNPLIKDSKDVLPKEVVEMGLYFGMRESDFLDNFKYEDKSTSFGFRNIYTLKTKHPDIELISLYFDTDDNSPLYEMIILYPDEEKARQAGIAVLGQPNLNGTEWMFKRNNSHDIKAWNYQNKLIVTALIPNTEWYEEMYGTK